MTSLLRHVANYAKNKAGSVSVEGSFLVGIMTVSVGASVEAAHAFWQWNAAQQSARVGARIASLSDPVSDALATMTGLSNSVSAGDELPAYTIVCSGASQSCSDGGFNKDAFNRIVYGSSEKACSSASRDQRGMCDLFRKVKPENVTITYESSGLGIAGEPAIPVPLITVKVTNIPLNFVFIKLVSGNTFTMLADVEVGVLGEDLKSNA